MKLTFQIAVRFLLAKRRAMLMSLAGILFGVAFFILTQAQTGGFEDFFIRTILGTNGAIRVQDRWRPSVTTIAAQGDGNQAGFHIPLRHMANFESGVEHPRRVMEAVRRFKGVSGVSQVLRERLFISSGFTTVKCQVFGIELSDYLSVSDLGRQIKHGDLSAFRDDPGGVILGWRLALRLNARLGDYVFLHDVGEKRRYRVRAVFETGVSEFDKYSCFIHLADARLLSGKSHSDYLQVALYNPEHAPRIAAHMEAALGRTVAFWQERERTWLDVFRVLRISSALTMSTIILIAGLGMFNTLAIIVMERQREIAILRSMGYSRRDIVLIFMNQGLVVLAAGTLLGWAAAALLTLGVENLPIHIRGIFSTDHFVVKWSLWHYLHAAAVAAAVVLVASYLPARRAARIDPAEIIRGAGG